MLDLIIGGLVAIIFCVEIFIAFKYRKFLMVTLKSQFSRGKAGKFVCIVRPADGFVDFDVWVPDKKDGKVHLKDKTTIDFAKNTVFHNAMTDSPMVFVRHGESSTFDPSSNSSDVMSSARVTDLVLAAENLAKQEQAKDEKLLLIIGGLVALAIIAAAVLSLMNMNMNSEILALLKAMQPVATNATTQVLTAAQIG